MENGNLREYIRGNLDVDRMRLLSQVASGVEFLHEEGIIHGDLCDVRCRRVSQAIPYIFNPGKHFNQWRRQSVCLWVRYV